MEVLRKRYPFQGLLAYDPCLLSTLYIVAWLKQTAGNPDRSLVCVSCVCSGVSECVCVVCVCG